MFFSFRPQLIFNYFHSVLISGSCLERVYSFKYLGVLLTPNLSWLPHIKFLRSKAKRILGLIYRQFYQSCPPSTLLVLYKSLVRPVLEYCSILWDPSSKNTINSIESVQYLALKIVSKSWNSDYESLLSQFNLQTLQYRRKKAKVIEIFKLKYRLSHHLYSPLTPSPQPIRFSRHYSPFNFTPIACRTVSYYNSFYPSAIKLWNSLPESIKSSSSLSLINSLIIT